jgi:cell shape-determining protein MreC
VIAALALTSALLITLDLQGNTAVGSARRGFGTVFEPFEDAARVVSRPVENAWRGVRDYPDVSAENQRLREQIAQMEADHTQALADIATARELMAADGLDPSLGIETVLARVLGGSPTNFDETITINKGSDSGIKIGNMVIVGQSLVGKVTEVSTDQSTVMLITDPRFAVAVKIENFTEDETTTTTTVAPDGSVPAGTDESAGSTSTTTEPSTTTTTVAPTETTTTLVGGAVPDDPLAPPTTLAPDPTAPAQQARQEGTLVGRGPDHDPYVVRVDDTRRFGQTAIGALVRTSGGNGKSLAPEDLLVGTVTKKLEQAGSGGDTLEVEPAVDLSALDIVAVLKYPTGG